MNDAPTISQYQNDVARTHFSLGELAARGQSRPQAEKPLLEAARIWGKLTERHPAVTEFHTSLAETHTALARVYSSIGNRKKAEEQAAQALAIKQKLAQTHGDSKAFQDDVARGYMGLGDVHRAALQAPQATAAYEEAARILEELVRDLPKVALYQADLARTYDRLGLLHHRVREEGKAEAAFTKALSWWDRLVSEHPEDLEFLHGQTMAAVNLGLVMRTAGNMPRALEWFARALQPLEALNPTERRAPAIRVALREAYFGRSQTLTKADRHREALEDWDRAIALAGKADQDRAPFARVVLLARTGAHKEAADAAEALLAKAGNGMQQNYQLACAFALAVGAAAADGKLPEEQRGTLADRYAALAMDRLRAVQTTAFFKQQANRDRLHNDRDLAAIRTRPEFRDFAQGVLAQNDGNSR